MSSGSFTATVVTIAAVVMSVLVVRTGASVYGIDFIDSVSTSQLSCLQQQSNYMQTRIFMDANGGACDPVGSQNIKTAVQMGFNQAIGGYIFPNPPSMENGVHTPSQQVQMAMWCGTASGLQKSMYTLDIELDQYNPWPDCSTSADYILEMIAEVWQYSDVVTIYTSQYEWQTVTCQTVGVDNGFDERLHRIANQVQSDPYRTPEENALRLIRTAAAKNLTNGPWSISEEDLTAALAKPDVIPFTSAEDNNDNNEDNQQNQPFRPYIHRYGSKATNTMLLWYANWDGQANFNDFVPFGPFKGPFSKQYADNGNVCGIPCDLDVSF